MSCKVVIPQDISSLGKEFLKEKGYEVVIENGRTDPEYLLELVSDFALSLLTS